MQTMNLYKCPICDKKFKALYMLKQHFRRHYLDDKCPICGYSGHVIIHCSKQKDIEHLTIFFLNHRGTKDKIVMRTLKDANITVEQIIEGLKI